ncbi:thioesterase family protein [soil metagenome]
MTGALFDRLPDGSYLPAALTRGGWSDDAQHGSPPSGLMAHAVEDVPVAGPMEVARFTIDLFRPVPLTPLRVETDVRRDGKRIQVVEVRLSAEGVEVGQVSALRVRRGVVGLDRSPTDLLEPGPERLTVLDWREAFGGSPGLERFHTDGVEIRTIDDSFVRPVPGRSWFRLLHPVVAGEAVSPFVRAATLADMANGNSQVLDPRRYLYVNPDTTLYLHRQPDGEWLGMQSTAFQGPEGVGMVDTALYDRSGRVGHVVQAQLLEER